MMNRRQLLILAALLLICCSCGGREQPTLTPVTLAASKNLWNTLPLIAQAQGFFRAEGLDPTVTYLDAGRYCMDAVVSGSTNFGNVVEVNVAFLGFSANQDISIVGTVVESTSSAIIARRSAGITKPSDLAGKIVALSPGTTSDVFANWYLPKNGVPIEAVNLRRIQPAAIQQAVIAQEVDAASTWQPFVYNISKAMGSDAIEFRDPAAYRGYENVAVRKSWAKEHPETVRAFLRALRVAEEFVKANPAEAQAIMAKEIALDPEIVKATWSEYTMMLSLDTPGLAKHIGQIGTWISATQDGFKGKPVPDYTVYLDDTYLQSIRNRR